MSRYDPLTPIERSERMAKIKNANTKPEMIVRQMVYSMGYRYRLHVRSLPGNPDIVFRPREKAIFVHGCFWHQHGCRQYKMPRTKLSFWKPKLTKNKVRDAKVKRDLRKLGWQTMSIWECQIKKETMLKHRIESFLKK